MSAFFALLGFDALVLLTGAVLTATGNRTSTLKRNQAKPQRETSRG